MLWGDYKSSRQNTKKSPLAAVIKSLKLSLVMKFSLVLNFFECSPHRVKNVKTVHAFSALSETVSDLS